jgi:hypothetical protein
LNVLFQRAKADLVPLILASEFLIEIVWIAPTERENSRAELNKWQRALLS